MTGSAFPVLLAAVLLAGGGSAQLEQPGQDLTLCATVGPLRLTQGDAVVFGRYLLPPLWSVRRDVKFQVCTADGRAHAGQFFFEVVIEPLTPDIGAGSVSTYSAASDERGRFTGMYGAANRAEGPAWPEGLTSAELHHFRLRGRTVATYVLERQARDLRFYRK